MARRAKIYKTNKQKKKKVAITTASYPHILQIQTAEEKAQANHFNFRVYRAIREDILGL